MRRPTSLHSALLLLGALTVAGSAPHAVGGQQAPRHFTLSAADGVRVAAYEWAGPAADAPYLLLFHQGGGDALGEYTPIAPPLAAAGYNVLAIDQRSGGELFGGTNRTAAGLGREATGYCEPMADLEAALDYARDRNPGRKAVLWGSSYSAALVVILAERRPGDVAGVLAFSPATGDPMDGCRPEDAASRLEVPLIAFRPDREAELPPVAEQLDVLREQGHDVHVISPGVHGSSMLVEERVRADVTERWGIVMDFLGRLNPGG